MVSELDSTKALPDAALTSTYQVSLEERPYKPEIIESVPGSAFHYGLSDSIPASGLSALFNKASREDSTPLFRS